MKTSCPYSKAVLPLALSAAIGSSLTGTSALADTIMYIDFDGAFQMYTDPTTSINGDGHPAVGTMTVVIPDLDPAGPYDGTAQMNSVIPFFGHDWVADGTMDVYQPLTPGLPAYCSGFDMCADASILFNWNGQAIPVDASFGMTAMTPLDILDPLQTLLNVGSGDLAPYFFVESIDREADGLPNGVPGTEMTSGPFTGVSPYFWGNAILTEVCTGYIEGVFGGICTPLDPGAILPEFHAPEVPVPAAAWLFGSGIVGLVGIARRKKRTS